MSARTIPTELHPLLAELMTSYEPQEALRLLADVCKRHAIKIAPTDASDAKKWLALSVRLAAAADGSEEKSSC